MQGIGFFNYFRSVSSSDGPGWRYKKCGSHSRSSHWSLPHDLVKWSPRVNLSNLSASTRHGYRVALSVPHIHPMINYETVSSGSPSNHGSSWMDFHGWQPPYTARLAVCLLPHYNLKTLMIKQLSDEGRTDLNLILFGEFEILAVSLCYYGDILRLTIDRPPQ